MFPLNKWEVHEIHFGFSDSRGSVSHRIVSFHSIRRGKTSHRRCHSFLLISIFAPRELIISICIASAVVNEASIRSMTISKENSFLRVGGWVGARRGSKVVEMRRFPVLVVPRQLMTQQT